MVEKDWVDDDEMSADETIARFEALDPEPTIGPRPGQHTIVEFDGRQADESDS